jgi:hypothetical protein
MSLALIVGVGVSLKTQASPKKEVITTYYSDATHKEIVGEKTFTCGRRVIQWGDKTKFYTKESIPCD